jgi:hypothetical protein
MCFIFQGRRASLRSALAPGYYIPVPSALKNQSIPQLHLLHFEIEFTIYHFSFAIRGDRITLNVDR